MRIQSHRIKVSFVLLAGVLLVSGLAALGAVGRIVTAANPADRDEEKLLRGTGAVGDWTNDAPGVRHLVKATDFPAPYATPASRNGPKIVPRPQGLALKAPDGFKVEEYASGLQGPRLIRSAPNGDLFVAESGRGRITVLRGLTSQGRNEKTAVFAEGLSQPFGIAFFPPGENPHYVYIA